MDSVGALTLLRQQGFTDATATELLKWLGDKNGRSLTLMPAPGEGGLLLWRRNDGEWVSAR